MTPRSSMEALILGLAQRIGRAPLVVALDATASAIAYIFLLQLIAPGTQIVSLQTSLHVAWLVSSSIFGSLLFNVQHRSWRFISSPDLPPLCKFLAFMTVSFATPLCLSLYNPRLIMLSLASFSLLLSLLVIIPRLIVRSRFRCDAALARDNIPILIVGGGWTTENFVRACRFATGTRSYQPIGILTRPPADIGRTIQGVPVLGSYDQLAEVAGDLRRRGIPLRQIALSPSRDEIDAHTYRSTCLRAQQLNLHVARLPRVTELADAWAPPTHLQPVAISDLLGRTGVRSDTTVAQPLVARRSILITGAGGTIGSELSRQIARLRPAKLILLDNSEYNLYRIDLEIKDAGLGDSVKCLVCDVRDSERISSIFAQHRPEIVFHAAAMKHVPIVEENPSAGVLTNILGTCNIANASLACDVRAMTLISTDKAVNPKNAMGATKRVCERYCQGLQSMHPEKTRFLSVRFGNVAASSGSVIPLFQRQIALGLPLTVTHPDMRRFFMTSEEAVQLVLHATSLSLEVDRPYERGHVYVLDMGEPIRIAELAAKMIRLAGWVPGKDLEIEFVGLRAGEKLDEMLFCDGEVVRRTKVRNVLEALSAPVSFPKLRRLVDDLTMAAREYDDQAVRRLLVAAVKFCDSDAQKRAASRQASTRRSHDERLAIAAVQG